MKKLVLFLFVSLFSFLYSEKTDVLFICFDAGETNAFIPVIEKMEKNHEEYRIVAFGTACDLIEKTSFAAKSSFIKKDCRTGESIERSWPREKELSLEQVHELTEAFEPKIVLSGVAAVLQKQLLESFDSKSCTVAYWDNFSPNGEGDYFKVAHRVQKAASFLFLPSLSVVEAPEFQGKMIKIAGQPSLEKWGEKIQNMNVDALKKKWSDSEFLIAYIGGYGEAYERAFDVFVKCVDELQKKG